MARAPRLLIAAIALACGCPGFGRPILAPKGPATAIHGPITWTPAGRELSISIWPPDPAATDAGQAVGRGMAAAAAAIERWSAILSPGPGSEATAMNRALAAGEGHRATLSKDLAEFIHVCLAGARATNGGFDPTGGYWEGTRLDGLELTAPGGSFDSWLLSDAWIADRAVDAIRSAGLESAVVAVQRGYVVAVLGSPNPGGPASPIPLDIPLARLSDRGVVGGESSAPATVVVAHNAASAQIFSIALRNLEPDKAFELLERRKVEGWRRDPGWSEPRTTTGWATLVGE